MIPPTAAVYNMYLLLKLHHILSLYTCMFVNVCIVLMYCTVKVRVDLVVSRQQRCYFAL